MMNQNTRTLLSSQTTAISEPLIQAYVETNYIVHTQPAITLRVNEQSPQVMKLHKQYRVACSAFTTAFNPIFLVKLYALGSISGGKFI
jgi:hypothetical protein